MLQTISEKDKKALKFGAIAAVIIITTTFTFDWFDDWRQVKNQLRIQRKKVDSIIGSNGASTAKQAGIMSIVPKFEMPVSADSQKENFRNKFNDQLKQAGIKVTTLKSLPIAKSKTDASMKILKLQCQGKCEFGQVTALLASLYDNPYFVGIENMRLTADKKKKGSVDMNLTVTTFVK